MLDVKEKEQIRKAVLVEGKSQRQVAQETGHSRNTVRKMLENGEAPRYRQKRPRSSPVLGPFKALIDAWIAEDEKKPKKKRRTARRMYTLLSGEEYGYRGAESTLRAYVGRVRKRIRNQVYLPLGYEPGEVGQVDFGEAEVIIAGERVTAQLLLVWLGYSSSTFVKAYPGQTQEVFFDGLASGFEYFGGVPRELWFDNLKAAVNKILKGTKREEQEAFIAFRSHYLFAAEFCNIQASWEKGGVEGRVGYGRRNWLIPLMEFPSWEALNAYLRSQCEVELERRLRGRSETIGERLTEEREHFLPLPVHRYPCCATVPVQPNHLALVSHHTNRYSVPVEHAHEKMVLRAYSDRIEIANHSQTLAVHPRCWGREQDILDPQHYLSLLARRPCAFERAKPLKVWRQQWPAVFDTYWEALKAHHPDQQGTKTFIQVLQLCQDYPEEVLAEVLHQALDCHCYQVEGVRELLRRKMEPARPAPADLRAYPELVRVAVQPPDLQRFNQLLHPGGGS
jgi:transposase